MHGLHDSEARNVREVVFNAVASPQSTKILAKHVRRRAAGIDSRIGVALEVLQMKMGIDDPRHGNGPAAFL
jgi:hypothetical protein